MKSYLLNLRLYSKLVVIEGDTYHVLFMEYSTFNFRAFFSIFYTLQIDFLNWFILATVNSQF